MVLDLEELTFGLEGRHVNKYNSNRFRVTVVVMNTLFIFN